MTSALYLHLVISLKFDMICPSVCGFILWRVFDSVLLSELVCLYFGWIGISAVSGDDIY